MRRRDILKGAAGVAGIVALAGASGESKTTARPTSYDEADTLEIRSQRVLSGREYRHMLAVRGWRRAHDSHGFIQPIFQDRDQGLILVPRGDPDLDQALRNFRLLRDGSARDRYRGIWVRRGHSAAI
jgi:hypothetical protein